MKIKILLKLLLVLCSMQKDKCMASYEHTTCARGNPGQQFSCYEHCDTNYNQCMSFDDNELHEQKKPPTGEK